MWTWIAVTEIALVALLVFEARDVVAGRWVAKPLASTGFLATAVAAGAADTPYGRVVLVALAFCWLGDVLLIPKPDAIFRLGVLAFLLGHVGLVAAFLRFGVSPVATAAAAAVLVLPAAGVLRWLGPRVPAGLKGPVVAYVAVISAMLACAVGAAVRPGGEWLLLGAALFYVSDLAVARDRFVQPGFANRIWGLPLYYHATLVLAASVALVEA